MDLLQGALGQSWTHGKLKVAGMFFKVIGGNQLCTGNYLGDVNNRAEGQNNDN